MQYNLMDSQREVIHPALIDSLVIHAMEAKASKIRATPRRFADDAAIAFARRALKVASTGVKSLTPRVRYVIKAKGAWVEDLTQFGCVEKNPGPPPTRVCHNCNLPGHLKRDCPNPVVARGRRPPRRGRNNDLVADSVAASVARAQGDIDGLRQVIMDIAEGPQRPEMLPPIPPKPDDNPVPPTSEASHIWDLYKDATNKRFDLYLYNIPEGQLPIYNFIGLMCLFLSISLIFVIGVLWEFELDYHVNGHGRELLALEDVQWDKLTMITTLLGFVAFCLFVTFWKFYQSRYLLYSAKFEGMADSDIFTGDKRADAIALQKLKHTPILAYVRYTKYKRFLCFNLRTHSRVLKVSLEVYTQICHAKNLSLVLNNSDAWHSLYHSAQTLQSVGIDRAHVFTDDLLVQDTAILSDLKYKVMHQQREWMAFQKPTQ